MESLPAPHPEFIEIRTNNKIDTYSCSKCSSNIEIESINIKDALITFKCLNDNDKDNHHLQTIPIKEYINNMEKNIYLYDECSICHQKQNYNCNLPIFKYCINCREIICHNCFDNHHNNTNKIHCYINNNEKMTTCLLHSKNNSFIEYCFDCKRHLCNECLKTKEHKKHNKNNIYEIQITNESKTRHNEIIDVLKTEKNNEIEELNELNEICEKEESKIKAEYNDKLDKIKNKFNSKLNERKNKIEEELDYLEKLKEQKKKDYNNYFHIFLGHFLKFH